MSLAILLGLLVLVFAGTGNRPVAQVGTYTITKDRFERMFNSFRKHVIHLSIKAPTRVNKERFLLELIKGIIVEEEAKKLNIYVSKVEVDKRLKKWGIVEADPQIREFVKREILTEKISRELGKDVYITYREVQAYYLLNRREFYLPARVKLLGVIARSKTKAWEARKQLMEGTLPRNSDYVKVGKERWYSVEVLPRMVRKRLPSLKVGSVSEPIRFGDSYVIFKVVDRKNAGVMSLEEAQDMIEKKLFEEKIKEEFRKWFREKLERYNVRLYLEYL